MRTAGFTLVELIITMTIFATLIAITVPNLLGTRNRVAVRSNVGIVVADIRHQQLKAMLGETEGRSTADSYGVHFETSTYTLFHGSSYSAIEPTNAVVPLNEGLQFSNVSLPSSSIIFNKGSGTVAGFSSNSHSVTLTNPGNNESVSISFNSYGLVTGVQ
ncbi:MAG TPA: type II secretion system protein [Candidatus Saccharimonadia bacterium]|nr:type II secretion system protein [Candidatus Saccharimonadia bacterium]